MRRAGLFRVLQPRRWGGYEMDLPHLLRDPTRAGRRRHVDGMDLRRVRACIPGSWRCSAIARRRKSGAATTSTLICSSLMPAGKASAPPRAAIGSADAGDMRVVARIATGRCSAPWLRPRQRRAARGAHLSPAAQGLRDRRHLAGVAACRRPEAGTSSSTTCSCRPIDRRACSTISCSRGSWAGAQYLAASIGCRSGRFSCAASRRRRSARCRACSTHSLHYGKTRVTRAGGRSAENPFVQLLCAETAAAIDEMKSTLASATSATCTPMPERGETPPLGRAPAMQVSIDRGHGALHAARRAHLQGDGSRRPVGGSAVRWNSRGSHGGPCSTFPINTNMSAAAGAA